MGRTKNASSAAASGFILIASGMSWWTSGPVSDPKELGGVLKKAVEVVKSGQPALVDVISQPR